VFDSLKKKLKNVIEKVSRKITEEKEVEEKIEIREEVKKEPEISRVLEEIKKREAEPLPEEILPAEEKPEIEKGVKEKAPAIAKEAELKEEVKEEIEKIEEELKTEIEIKKELKEKIEKETLPEELEEEKEPEIEKKELEIEEYEKEIKKEPEERVSTIEKIKKGFIEKFVKRVKEKTLSEDDVEKVLKELQVVLLENDVALPVAERICDDLKNDLLNKSVSRGRVEEVIKESLRKALLDVMSQEKLDIEELIEKKYSETKEPFLIIFLGFNGTGKTTNLCKLAYRLKKFRPVLAAGDTFRTASIEQLEEHARRLKADIVKHKYGADSAAVIFDAVKHAKAVGSKVVLADTAGRSHANVNLMDELKKVCKVNKPDMKILVLDSITGNDIYDQSRLFNEAIGVDAMILTKADVYQKGGAALSASHTIEKPILFLGTGQEYEDLKEFVPEDIVNNLLD
jgi:fused signal recognition particle receptor